MKKNLKLIIGLMVGLLVGVVLTFAGFKLFTKEDKLPLPQKSEGMRGDFGIDKNINEETIDNYLYLENSVYRDVRMLEDPAEFENIGGDSYLSGFVKGFEIIPYPYLVNVTGLPSEVGESHTGKTLFTLSSDGKYSANYEESLQLLEYYFPKDKTIFIMCGGGGYAGQAKDMLVSLGWDQNKIYNVGGYWYYNGKNKVETKKEVDGKSYYDFSKVAYYDINFDTLHEVK